VGDGVALQGNLDPAVVFATPDAVRSRVDAVLDSAKGLPGHVFNLGHGVLPTSDPEVLAAVVRQVHERTSATL
jgi:uroporphyrinogen decarboxylase